MALTDQVIMPGADYQAAANQVRALNGTTATLKSGEMVTALEGANDTVAAQTSKINDLIQQANNLPDAGGSGGTDIALGITGATVGQIAKITAVDSNGKPTAWAPVDMPSGDGLHWIEVADITTEEQTKKLTISVDKDGRPISQYNALWMIFTIYFPADASQTSANGSPWIFPLPKIGDNAYRYIANVAGWKTIGRTITCAWAGLPRINWSSEMAAQSTFGAGTDGDPDFLSGFCVYINSSSDHIPAGTRVRIAVLSKGVTV